MSQVDYDLLVIGDDPSAFWLLRELSRLSSGKARLGWFSLAAERKPVPVPIAVAEKFTLHVSTTWNLEFGTPAGPFTWNEAEIARRYPAFPARSIADDFLAGRKTALATAAQVLKAHPDLFGLAESVWRAFHYSETTSAETKIVGLALASHWGWWDFEKELPKGLGMISRQGKQLESVRSLKGGGFSVRIEANAPVSTKRIVIAATGPELQSLAKVIESVGVGLENIPPSKNTRYPFTVQAARNAIPWCLAPWNILLDASDIPDVDSEVTPLEVTVGFPSHDVTELKAWVTAPSDPSLEAVLFGMQAALGRLCGFFPFLPTQARSFSPTLELEALHSDELRQSTLSSIQQGARALYAASGLEPRTRAPGFYLLGPFHRCHLPYPVGPLTGAEFILKEVLAQDKRRFEKQKGLSPNQF